MWQPQPLAFPHSYRFTRCSRCSRLHWHHRCCQFQLRFRFYAPSVTPALKRNPQPPETPLKRTHTHTHTHSGKMLKLLMLTLRLAWNTRNIYSFVFYFLLLGCQGGRKIRARPQNHHHHQLERGPPLQTLHSSCLASDLFDWHFFLRWLHRNPNIMSTVIFHGHSRLEQPKWSRQFFKNKDSEDSGWQDFHCHCACDTRRQAATWERPSPMDKTLLKFSSFVSVISSSSSSWKS